MNNQSRFILFIILSMLVVGATTLFFPPPPQPPAAVSAGPQTLGAAAEASGSSSAAVMRPGTAKAPGETALLAKTASVPVSEITIETAEYVATFSNQGAVLTGFTLKKFQDRQTKKSIQLVNQDPTHPKPLAVDYDPLPGLTQSVFEVRGESQKLTGPDAKAKLAFRYVDANGTALEKTIGFRNGSYLMDLDVRVSHSGPGTVPASNLTIEWADTLGKEENTGTQSRVGGYRVATLAGDRVDSESTKKSQESKEIPGPIEWTALANQFFVAALIPDRSTGAASARIVRDLNAFKSPTPEDPNPGIDPRTFTPRPMLVYAGQALGSGESFERKASIFFGPQDYSLLKGLHLQLDRVVDFGMFGFISVYMVMLLKWFYTWCHNWGLAILFLSVMVKLVLWFPTHTSYKNMSQTQSKMKELQPKLDAIKRKYADLRQKKADLTKFPGEQQETAALYQQAGLNPLSGCLPMLLQLPIFYALYGTLYHSIELRGAPFLWLGDLTLKDPIFVLPLLMGGTMILQQRVSGQMSTQTTGQQKFMMWFFPIFLTFISFQWPSGLLLYWVVTNVLSMIQQKIVNKEIKKAKKKDEVIRS